MIIPLLLLALSLPSTGWAAHSHTPVDPAADWWRLALRLTGESDAVRVDALRALRKIHGLEGVLRHELAGERRFLALDVIAALKLRQLLDDLVQFAETDETGFAYSAINTLMSDADRDKLVELYRRRAIALATSPASRMVLLDTLGRMNEALLPEELEALLRHPSYDVREAALSHLRHVLVRLGRLEYLPYVFTSFETNPRTLRLQALSLLSEVAAGGRRRLPEAIQARAVACARPPNPSEVIALCLASRGRKS